MAATVGKGLMVDKYELREGYHYSDRYIPSSVTLRLNHQKMEATQKSCVHCVELKSRELDGW